jgi:hypothetical protein
MLIFVLIVFNAPIAVVAIGLPFLASLSSALMEKNGDVGSETTSYSRISGLFGSVMISAFFWALGNVIIWKAFENPAQIEPIIDSVAKFFLVGSALFLPYAFNQLRLIFAPLSLLSSRGNLPVSTKNSGVAE